METYKQILKEASLSRVYKHVHDTEVPIAILSAFRDEYSREENHARNRVLAAEIKNAGYGYFYIEGHWDEQITEDIAHVKEDAIFVIGKKNDSGRLKSLIKNLIGKFDQDAAVFKNESTDETSLIFNDGSEEVLGSFSVGKAEAAYSELKHGKGHFVFEAERDGVGYFGQLAKKGVE